MYSLPDTLTRDIDMEANFVKAGTVILAIAVIVLGLAVTAITSVVAIWAVNFLLEEVLLYPAATAIVAIMALIIAVGLRRHLNQ